MRRFVNADIVAGAISEAVTLNRFAYANGNPVSLIDPFGLAAWSNWLKVGIGAVVIVGLAVATAVTGGAAAVVCGAALTGAVIGGTTGAVSGYIDGGWDGAATGFMTGTVAGGASGTVAASTFNPLAVAACNVAIDVGEYIMGEYADGTEDTITAGKLFFEAGTSLILGNIDIELKKINLKKINLKNINPVKKISFDFKPGWLNEAGDLLHDYELLKHIIEREARRVNRDYAEKHLVRAGKQFYDVLSARLWEYGIDATKDGIDDIVKSVIRDIFKNDSQNDTGDSDFQKK